MKLRILKPIIQLARFHYLFLFFSFLFLGISLPQIYSQPEDERIFVKSALGLEMILVPVHDAGHPIDFTAGSKASEPGRLTNENEHKVFLTKPFYLGRFEVTQAEYEAVLNNNLKGYDPRPSNFAKTETRPVESVTWHEANYFVELLNEKERITGSLPPNWSYSLPTEAEWEFACRAGSLTAYNTGVQIENNQANFLSNESNQTVTVGSFSPNAWGFHDMHGNVREWCYDWYQDQYQGTFVDPMGVDFVLDSTGFYRNPYDFVYFSSKVISNSNHSGVPKKVCRGGAFDSEVTGLRSARRYHLLPTTKKINLGFRIALRREDSNTTLENSLSSNIVTFQSGDLYRFETFWEEATDLASLQSTSKEIGDLLQLPTDSFSEYFSVRTIYSTNNSTVKRPSASGNQEVATLAYEVNATHVDSSGQQNAVIREVSFDSFRNFIKLSKPTLLDSQSINLDDSEFSFQTGAFAFTKSWQESFSDKFSQFLEHGNFLGSSSGWMWTDWFGYYYAGKFPWVFHENLGWIYVNQKQVDNTWFYRDNLGWAWTTSADWWRNIEMDAQVGKSNEYAFPYLFRYGIDENDTKIWTFINRQKIDTTLYDFSDEEWFALDQPYDVNVTVLPTGAGSVRGNGKYYRWEKVDLNATANSNFGFIKWDGTTNILGSNYIFLAKGNKSLNAIFLPQVSSTLSPVEKVNSYKEILNGMSWLSSQQKEWALTELLVFGKSTTAGIH